MPYFAEETFKSLPTRNQRSKLRQVTFQQAAQTHRAFRRCTVEPRCFFKLVLWHLPPHFLLAPDFGQLHPSIGLLYSPTSGQLQSIIKQLQILTVHYIFFFLGFWGVFFWLFNGFFVCFFLKAMSGETLHTEHQMVCRWHCLYILSLTASILLNF